MKRTRETRALAALLALALAHAGCGTDRFRFGGPSAPATSFALGTQAACEPSFPDQDGWLGGDSAASIALPHGDGRTSLWLFGDSFIARPGPPAERSYPFVHNAIAVSRCDERGVWHLDFALTGGPDSAAQSPPRAFFEPDPEAAWVTEVRREPGDEAYYWPISAALAGDAVEVALLRVASGPSTGPLRLPFRLLGVDLARIEDTAGPPEAWRIRYATLSSRSDVLPASSLVSLAPHLYAFAFLAREDGRSPRILTRVPLAALAAGGDSVEGAVETLSRDGRWVPGLDPARARILMSDSATEMSVHFDPGLREWLAVYSFLPVEANDPFADSIWIRRAPRITGPWSWPRPLVDFSELEARADPLPGELFCYAGKAHPELAHSAELLVTWVCNVYAERDDEIGAVLERLRTTRSIYRPQVRRIEVPAWVTRD